MKLTDPDHLEKIKHFYSIFGSTRIENYPYFILIYRLFDLCRQEIFQDRQFGGPFKRVLDVGCGIGYHTLRMAEFCEEIVGVDVSEKSIEVARREAKERGMTNVSFVCSDINHNPFPSASFDCVIAYGDVIGHIPDYKTAFSQMARLLLPGGLLSLDCDNKWYLGLIREWDELRVAVASPREGHARPWEFHGVGLDFNTFTQGELVRLLGSNGFKLLRTYGFDFFPFFIKTPERYQFSQTMGRMERFIMFLHRVDIAFRRYWPVNRLGYTKVIFARKMA